MDRTMHATFDICLGDRQSCGLSRQLADTATSHTKSLPKQHSAQSQRTRLRSNFLRFTMCNIRVRPNRPKPAKLQNWHELTEVALTFYSVTGSIRPPESICLQRRRPVLLASNSSALLDKCTQTDGAISRARTLRNRYSLHTTFVCSDFLIIFFINFVVTVSVARRPNKQLNI